MTPSWSWRPLEVRDHTGDCPHSPADGILTQVHLCAEKGFGPCSQDPSEIQQPKFDGYIPGQHQRRQLTRTD